jgi:hypothetical protein
LRHLSIDLASFFIAFSMYHLCHGRLIDGFFSLLYHHPIQNKCMDASELINQLITKPMAPTESGDEITGSGQRKSESGTGKRSYALAGLWGHEFCFIWETASPREIVS